MGIRDDDGHLTAPHLRVSSARVRPLEPELSEPLDQRTPAHRGQARHGEPSDGLGELIQVDPGHDGDRQAESETQGQPIAQGFP